MTSTYKLDFINFKTNIMKIENFKDFDNCFKKYVVGPSGGQHNYKGGIKDEWLNIKSIKKMFSEMSEDFPGNKHYN